MTGTEGLVSVECRPIGPIKIWTGLYTDQRPVPGEDGPDLDPRHSGKVWIQVSSLSLLETVRKE